MTMEERDQAIAAAYAAGRKLADIAAEFGISDTRVLRIARDGGCEPRRTDVGRKNPGYVILCDTVRETAVRNRGRASAGQIAEACDVTRNSIIGHWHRAGLQAGSKARSA